MTDLRNEYFKQQERIVQDNYEPAFRLFWNPRIERHLLCLDNRVTKKHSDPWVDRDSDLEGIEGVGERTPYTALKRLETCDGKPLPPLAPLIIKILALECPRQGDRDMGKEAWKQVHAREARQKASSHAVAEEFRVALINRLRGRKIFIP